MFYGRGQADWLGKKAHWLTTHACKEYISQCIPSWLKHHLIHPTSLPCHIEELNHWWVFMGKSKTVFQLQPRSWRSMEGSVFANKTKPQSTNKPIVETFVEFFTILYAPHCLISLASHLELVCRYTSHSCLLSALWSIMTRKDASRKPFVKAQEC